MEVEVVRAETGEHHLEVPLGTVVKKSWSERKNSQFGRWTRSRFIKWRTRRIR
jgi:hypothetical protein